MAAFKSEAIEHEMRGENKTLEGGVDSQRHITKTPMFNRNVLFIFFASGLNADWLGLEYDQYGETAYNTHRTPNGCVITGLNYETCRVYGDNFREEIEARIGPFPRSDNN